MSLIGQLSVALSLTAKISQCAIELQSIEVVDCANKNVCQNGKNLRIVLNASTIETTMGSGSITGTVTDGQTWTDANGDWELLEEIIIDIDYQNAQWEYQLNDEGAFWTKAEEWCGMSFFPGGMCDNGTSVSCLEKSGSGLEMIDGSQYTKYSIENIDSWEASVSIESSNLNFEWSPSNIAHTTADTDIELSMVASFDTTSCYQDLAGNYFVVVPVSGHEYYYFTSKQYWQDARNNFNLSLATWISDFDCDFVDAGWHTAIPFYETEAEYQTFCGGNNCQSAMWSSQMHAFANGYIDSVFMDIMDGCYDNTTYTDGSISHQGPIQDDKYIVRKDSGNIVDHFELTLDLDYTQFVKMPTQSPTPQPSQPPSENPTGVPSQSPIQAPTSEPSRPPTKSPSKSPTDSAFDTFDLFEIAAKLEITSSASINISSHQVQQDIIDSIASGLNYGREYIRLDSVQFQTTISGRRRLSSETESLLISFTVFTPTEEDKSFYAGKLEQTPVYGLIYASLSTKIPDMTGLFIANVANDCEEGTKPITVAGMHRCQSICGLNQYYDTTSSSCKDQIAYDPNAVQTVILIDWPSRCMYFGIGVALWIVTLAIIYLGYLCSKEYCCGNGDELSEESEQLMNDKERKQHIEASTNVVGKEEIELEEIGKERRKRSTQSTTPSTSLASDETYETQSTDSTGSTVSSDSQSKTESS